MTETDPEPTWLDRLLAAAEGVRDARASLRKATLDERDAQQRRLQAEQALAGHLDDLRVVLAEKVA